MNIVFVSNFMNHHQYLFCKELLKKCDHFLFISCSELPEEQRKLGYQCYEDDFIIKYDHRNIEYCRQMILNADSVIFGEKPEWIYKERLNMGKKDFVYSERLFKKGRWHSIIPTTRKKLINKYLKDIDYLPNILCAGSYVCKDFSLIGYPQNRCLKWGYFPPNLVDNYVDVLRKKTPNSIVWVGRLIDWKHPEIVIKVANKLKKNGVSFSLTIIGNGPLREKITKQVLKDHLEDCVKLVGPVNSNEIHEYFERSEIAVATSDKNEGWGAVVNEAMAGGCAAVVSEDMGSARYLIKNHENGIIYRHNSFLSLYESIFSILKDKEYCLNLGREAFCTIKNDWNYMTAANRLYEYIVNDVQFSSGILSQAE